MRSATRIAVIAGNTVREAVRNRVLYALLFFAVVLIGTGVVVAQLSYVERQRILQDVGLAALRLFGVAIAVFVGVGLIHKEVDRRTIHTILSKPVSRAEFLLGKYLGLVATVWLQVAIMACAFVVVSLGSGSEIDAGHAAAIGLAGVEVALVVAVATLFSSFSSPMLSSLFSVGVYAVGHLSRELREIGAKADEVALRHITEWLYRLLPDLESFNLTIEAVHRLPVSAADVWLPVVYGMGYTGLLLLLAVVIFERRDFR